MRFLKTWAYLIVALCISTASWGVEPYPSRPLRLIVGFAAGGTTDIVARYLGQRLGEELGQPVIIDNRAGAGGNLGTDAAARAAPDGYTLLLGTTSSIAVSPAIYPKLSYDPLRDLLPVGQVATVPSILAVTPGLPVRSAQELVALAKSQPGQLNFASAGIGSAPHLAGELLKTMTGIQVTHIPYRGDALALADLISGRVQFMFPSRPSVLPMIAAGQVRALAVTGRRRSASLPDVPTMIEAGFPDYAVESWFGIFVPAGTSADIVNRLNTALVRVLADPQTQQQFEKLGVDPVSSTPDELARYVRAEIKKWAEVARFAQVKAE